MPQTLYCQFPESGLVEKQVEIHPPRTTPMPYEYQVFSEHRLIYERAVGTVTDADFIKSFTAPSSDSELDLEFDVISDYRGCRNEISIEAVKHAAEIYATYFSGLSLGKWAVIPTDHRGRLRVRFFSYFVESPRICCCASIREALVCLDLPEDLID